MAVISENANDEVRLRFEGEHGAGGERARKSLADNAEGECLRANEAAGVGTWKWDPQTNLVDISGDSCRLMGLSNATSDLPGFLERLHPEDREIVARDLRESGSPGSVLDVEFRTLGGSGPGRWLRMVGKRSLLAQPRIEVCGILIGDGRKGDVESTGRLQTEKRLKDVEGALIQFSRFMALGDMAYALANETSQPLTALALYLQGCKTLLASAFPCDLKAVRDAVERASDQGLRASRIIATLRNFTARSETERSAQDLATLIGDACALSLIGGRNAGVAIFLAFDPGVGTVFVDKVQIQQVLLNLLQNAFDAMRNSPVRKLTISARTVDIGMVEVRVADTGSGIEPSFAERLFKPFATTKRDGLGVGLSNSQTIVEAHGGCLWAETDLTGGSVFKFTVAAAS